MAAKSSMGHGGELARRLVLSAPHSSAWIPTELVDRVALDASAVLTGTDVGTADLIRGFPAATSVFGSVNRLVLDLNRARGDRSPDGVFRQHDFFGRPVFRPHRDLSGKEQESLLERFYDPFHAKLCHALKTPASFFVEVHSMDEVGGAYSATGCSRRPDIVLGNFGDTEGEPEEERGYSTCSREALSRARQLLLRHFAGVAENIQFNDAFYGGWNTGCYGVPNGCGTPGFQFEINKRLFWDLRAGIDISRLEDTVRRFAAFLDDFSRFLTTASTESLRGSLWRPAGSESSQATSQSTDPVASGGLRCDKAVSPKDDRAVNAEFARHAEVMGDLVVAELEPNHRTLCVFGCGNAAIAAEVARRVEAEAIHLLGSNADALIEGGDRLRLVGCVPFTHALARLAEGLPFTSTSLDAVISVNVLHKFTHHAKRRFLNEVGRVLRPGGRLALVDVVIGDPAERLQWRKPAAMRPRVAACPNCSPGFRDGISEHSFDSRCTCAVRYTLDNGDVATTAFMLCWLNALGLVSGVSARHGSLSDYVITGNRNDCPWASPTLRSAPVASSGGSLA